MPQPPGPNWKEDWPAARQHHLDWWEHRGPVLIFLELPPLDEPRPDAPPPDPPPDHRHRHTDPDWFARNQRALLARQRFCADTLPIAHVDYGCVQLAACFGSEPDFDEETVWYNPCVPDPDACPILTLDRAAPWYRAYFQIMQRVLADSRGDYLVGMPAFGSNLDVLAELRGTQELLYDLIDRPQWVDDKLEEINRAFFDIYDDYYAQIALADGSSAYTYFHLWGPGKVSQVQCDFSAMISPDMFARFVVPALQRQCAWLDKSMFHLDGPNCIGHLDHLLQIPELDAVQWTPGAGQPGAGDPKWFELYERILAAGKSVQVIETTADQTRRVFDTFGPAGVYVMCKGATLDEAAALTEYVDTLR